MIVKEKEAYNEIVEFAKKYRKISTEKVTIIHIYHQEQKINILEKKTVKRCKECEGK